MGDGSNKMADNSKKLAILKGAGFRYHFDRAIYFNRQSRKVFSLEAIEDHDEVWLQRCVDENTDQNEWTFYFNSPFSAAIQDALTVELSR